MSLIFIDEAYAGNILQNLWLQCQRKEYCDLELIVGAEELRIPTHRNVLAAASQYFKEMLHGHLRKEIKITNLCSKLFIKFNEYFYTGRIEICADNAIALLEMANLLLLTNVVTACENFLVRILNSRNCFKFMVLAEKYSCENLLEKSKRYCLKHLMEATRTTEFNNLTADQLSELLANDDLQVSSEEDVFNSFMRWIQHDPTEREKYKAKLLRSLRMPLLELSFLVNNVKQICTSLESLHVYTEALENSYPDCNTTNPRNKQFLMATVLDDKMKRMYIHYYCPQRLMWMKWLKDLEYRYSYGVATQEDNLYIVGGKDSADQFLNSVICLNLKTMTVSELTPMTEKRDGCRAAVLEGFLYAVGGVGLNSVEKWDPVNKTWSFVASMSKERNSFGFAVLNEKLYVVGGQDSLTTAEYYDPHQNIWTSIATLNEGRFAPGIAVANGIIYAVGDFYDSKSVERYDPETNNWILIRSLNEPLNGYQSCTTFRNKVVVCYKDRIEEYNMEKNEWISKPTSNTIGDIYRLFTYSGRIQISEFTENKKN